MRMPCILLWWALSLVFSHIALGFVNDMEFFPDDTINLTVEELKNISLQPSRDLNERYLSRIGLPFIFSPDDGKGTIYMKDCILLVKKGICTNRMDSTRAYDLYFSLFPAALETLYGEERIDLMRAPDLSHYWLDLLDTTSNFFGDELTAAENELFERYRLRRNDLGAIQVRWTDPATGMTSADYSLFAKMDLFAREDPVQRTVLYTLSVIPPSRLLFEKRELFTSSRNRYAGFIHAYDAYVQNTTASWQQAIQESLNKTVLEFIQKQAMHKHYVEYQRNRANRTEEHPSPPAVTPVLTVERRMCHHLQQALDTLRHTPNVNLTADTRVERLRQLLEKHACTVDPADFTEPERDVVSPTGKPARLPSTALESVCISWKDMYDTTVVRRSPSASQLLALLVHAFAPTETSDEEPSADVDIPQFLNWVISLENALFANPCTCCATEPQLMAELRNFIAVSYFLSSSEKKGEGEEDVFPCRSVETGCQVRGLLAVQQALWKGSTNAASFLSFFSEQSFLLKKSRVMQRHLSLLPLEGKDLYMFRLLRKAFLRNVTVGSEDLLRYIRPFNNHYSWHHVNGHFITRETIASFYAHEEEETEDEEGHGTHDIYAENFDSRTEWGHTARLASREMQASFYVLGLKKVPQRFDKAECMLFVILRQMGYVCDLKDRSFSTNELADVCPEHTGELRSVLRKRKSQRILCEPVNFTENRGDLVMKGSYAPPFFYTPPRIGQYKLLQDVLMDIAYFYLLHGQRYDRVARYAAESLRLSYASYRVGLHLRNCRAETLWVANNTFKADKACRIDCKNHWACAKYLLKYAPWNVTNSTKTAVPTPLATGLLNREAFVLLAVSLLNTAPGTEAHEAIISLSVDSMKLLGITESETIDSKFHSLFLLFAAMKGWNSSSFIDHVGKSVTRTEPFFLVAWLMEQKEADGSYTFDLESIRELGSSTFRPLVGDTPLPHRGEPRVSYVDRLLVAAQRKVNNFKAKIALEKNRFRHARDYISADNVVVDRKMRMSFHYSQIGRQDMSEAINLEPLLYFTDFDDYLNENKTTALQGYIKKGLNALYYPFTETVDEQYGREMASVIAPPRTDAAQFAAGEELPPYLTSFVTLFYQRPSFRRLSIAYQLVTNTFLLGGPQGFSLLFNEAEHNGYLRPLADTVALVTYSPARTARIWYDQHVTAQWHQEKPETREYSSLFSHDITTPFMSIRSEPRQELASSLSRWQAASAIRRASELTADRDQQKKFLKFAKRTLSTCVGALYADSVARGREVDVTRVYRGMLFPAGDERCGRDLYALLQRTGATWAEKHYLLEVLDELNNDRAIFYGLKYDANKTKVEKDRLFLVEPWNLIQEDDGDDDRDLARMKVGEGIRFYNRHNTVTGAMYGTKLLLWWNWFWKLFLR
ncbi:hypothetical protein ADEAN_000163400 [Angomonas deanei]|uniref:Uncharacterized protein n=1 Tax=Angomonas deanei TaxID=59799 RepID=A0A7G2C3C8_9TRYP|nr:hypothetical protein ADEAN_000163400 [Angomonas deanei]